MSKCVKSSEKFLNIFLRHEYISRMLPPSSESSRWKEKFVKFFSCAIWFIRLAQILHFVWFIKLISISSPFGFLSEGFSMVFVFFLPTHVHVHMHDSLPKLSWSGPIVTNVAISKKIMPKSLKKTGNWIFAFHFFLRDFLIQSLKVIEIHASYKWRITPILCDLAFYLNWVDLLGQLGLNFRDNWGRKRHKNSARNQNKCSSYFLPFILYRNAK